MSQRIFPVFLVLSLLISLIPASIAQDRVETGIDVAGDVSADVPQIDYVFSGTAGQTIRVDLTALAPGMAPLFFVAAPDATLVRAYGNPEALGSISDTFQLPLDGDYVITIGSWNQVYGTLALRVNEATGQPPTGPQPPAIQQGCPAIVQTALTTVDQTCQLTGRNQICIGNLAVDALFRPDIIPSQFQEMGDIVDVVSIDSLQVSPMNLVDNTWGLALMKIQANLPDTQPGQNVTMLVFGDVVLRNSGGELSGVSFPATANVAVNERSGPGEGYAILGNMLAGETTSVVGKDPTGLWFRTRRDDNSLAWVIAGGLNVSGDVNTLSVVQPDEQVNTYGPMQAFYFSSGIGDSQCVEAPDSGILIQTPDGVGEIDLLVNEVRVSLGSTAFLSASENNNLTIGTLEGQAIVSAQGVEQIVPAGLQVAVPMNADLQPVAPPSDPVPLDLSLVESVPVDKLPKPITMPQVIQPAITSTPESGLPDLPTTGGCVIATLQNVFVNTRTGPSTDFPAQGQGMNPAQIYNVIGRNLESSWWQINDGWVGGGVTRRGGNCSNIPVTYIPPTATPTPLPTRTPTPAPTLDLRDTRRVYHVIDSVIVNFNGSGPYNLSVSVTGSQTDGCQYPVQIDVVWDGLEFISVDIYRNVPMGAICTAVILPYQNTIQLGSYAVDFMEVNVNGVSDYFYGPAS